MSCDHINNSENDNNYSFDAQGNMVDVAGAIIFPRHAVQQFGSYPSGMQHQEQQRVRTRGEHWRSFSTAHGQTLISPAADFARDHRTTANHTTPRQSPVTRHSHTSASAHLSPPPLQSPGPAGDRLASARLSLAIPGENTYITAPPQADVYTDTAAATSGVSGWSLPQSFSGSAALGFHHDSTFPADAPSWLPLQSNPDEPGFYANPSLPQQGTRNPLTPTIRVTTDHSGAQNFSAPQDATFSASPASSLPPDFNPYINNNNGRLSPQTRPYMPQESENMQTPVSPVSAHNSPHDTMMGEPQQQMSRKRSHSIMSQQDAAMQQALHSRAASVGSQIGASPGEEYSPRGSRAFKRGDPPTNHAGKYICDFAEECIGQTFDRKCEWSKHMDKHDRPYRCPHPSCAKLQGFTYSGGLLRHEREVHGKHGGPRAQLMCPHPDCKRHSGKGFTRKENLNEHLRRVHAAKDQNSQHDPSLLRDGADMPPGIDQAETPASLAGLENTDPALTSQDLKRKRSLPTIGEYGAPEDELKRLRAELDAKDMHIQQLQQHLAAQDERMQHLEATVLQLQQAPQQNQQHLPPQPQVLDEK